MHSSVLPDHGFRQLQQLAFESLGLHLKSGKEALISARLAKIMRNRGLESYDEYCRLVRADKTGEALDEMIDALTTNFTSFWREPAHFRFLNSDLMNRFNRSKPVKIWSAACSSGEEPYTLAFCFHDAGLASVARILATDISNKVLAVARAGIYPLERTAGIRPDQMRRYFLRGHKEATGLFQVKPEIRQMVEFRRANLMDKSPVMAECDIVFCRNVLIYFDKKTQQEVTQRLANSLKSGGHLFIGHSESINGVCKELAYIAPSIYEKK
jgi:chemotaxis protein methyltransferase CheR